MNTVAHEDITDRQRLEDIQMTEPVWDRLRKMATPGVMIDWSELMKTVDEAIERGRHLESLKVGLR